MFHELMAAAIPLVGSLAGAAMAATPDGGAAVAWTGRWMGVAVTHERDYRAEQLLSFEVKTADGALVLRDLDRLRGGPAVPLVVDGLEAHATYKGLMQQPITFVGHLSPDARTMTVSISGDGMTGLEGYRATLRHDDPDARRFQAPRLDKDGGREREYHYAPPAGQPDRIPVSTLAAEGIGQASVEAMVNDILAEGDAPDARRTESVLILRHGKLVLEEYFWGQSAGNPHTIASVTKSVTSMLTGAVHDSGRLDIDRAAVDFFPERKDLGWSGLKRPISVRNILAMSSGTQFESLSTAPGSIGLLDTDDVVKYATSAVPVSAPGTVYNYDNSLPALVGPLIARVTGQKVHAFADETLFGPLGIRNYRWTMLREGVPLTAGGLAMRPRDMAKLGLLMLGGGTWNGKRILSPEWVQKSTERQTAPGQYPYGFYWHLNTAAQRHVPGWDGYMAIGQGGQTIAVFPKQDLVIVMTSSNWLSGDLGTHAPFAIIGKYLVNAVR